MSLGLRRLGLDSSMIFMAVHVAAMTHVVPRVMSSGMCMVLPDLGQTHVWVA